MDVNYFAYLPFLQKYRHDLNPDAQPALDLILKWDGMRGNYRTGDNLGLHKGHILFYYWLESLNDHFKQKIAGPNKRLLASLGKGQLKLKQPKISSVSEQNMRLKLSTETSHNIPLGSRIILQALHSVSEAGFSLAAGFPSYRYDKSQFPLLENEKDAIKVITSSLKAAQDKARQNGWILDATEGDYMPQGSATFSGLSQTLALNDTRIGFRPGLPLQVRHFRNRGALNIGAALGPKTIRSANVSSPGIREYRGQSEARTDRQKATDWSINQLYMFRDNQYRPMHPLPPKK